LATLLPSAAVAAREAAPAAALTTASPWPAAGSAVAPESVVRVAASGPATPANSLIGSFGQGMISTASSLTFALTDGVKSTLRGGASLAGTVGGTVKTTVIGTINVAGTVSGIVTDTVRNTVSGTVDVAKTLVDTPQRMIQYATTMLGTPYKWGGNTIASGLDCSGFVREVVAGTTGKLLPRTARAMSRQGTQVAYGEMKPGDLVFFNTRRRPFSHVGIYLGDGRFMHGASGVKSGKQVRIDSFSSSYYRSRFNGARRVIPSEELGSAALPEIIASN
jgi:cell wall-associated NlpC family hydrolase